ncbi:unnamed protein product [Auanema sp. JU1783]|nr:unnamed protein product [Auanema sp. JU1783]
MRKLIRNSAKVVDLASYKKHLFSPSLEEVVKNYQKEVELESKSCKVKLSALYAKVLGTVEKAEEGMSSDEITDLEEKRRRILEQLREVEEDEPCPIKRFKPIESDIPETPEQNTIDNIEFNNPTNNGVNLDDYKVINPEPQCSSVSSPDTEDIAISPPDVANTESNKEDGKANPDQVEDLLEEAEANQDNSKTYWKMVLENMENDHFDPLPEGWCRMTHNCGLPIYLNRTTRVCTMSRPYFIGTGSVRNHKVPLTAIPCLHQKRLNDKKEKEETALQDNSRDIDEFGSKLLEKLPAPQIRIENSTDYQLGPKEITDYASSIFRFKKLQVSHYVSFEERKRKKNNARFEETLRDAGLTLDDVKGDEESIISPSGISLINIPTTDNRFHKKNFVMNPAGRTSLMILHEYVQRALRGRIVYDIDETNKLYRSAYNVRAVLYIKKSIRIQAAPTVKEKLALLQDRERTKVLYLVDGAKDDEDTIVMGIGQGTSKRAGKMVAAEMALKILMPNLRFNEEHIASLANQACPDEPYDVRAIELFDHLAIDDPRVSELCVKTGQPKPMVILKEACNRSMKLHGSQPSVVNRTVDHQQSEVTVTVGEYSCTVKSIGAKGGKQKAAQGILKQLHPELLNFGSILRLYASVQEKTDKMVTQKSHKEVVGLQNKGSRNAPNHAVLEKLREEMRKVLPSKIRRFEISTTFPLLPMPDVFPNEREDIVQAEYN